MMEKKSHRNGPAPLVVALILLAVGCMGAAARTSFGQAPPPQSSGTGGAFPLQAGTYWMYEAMVTWGPEGATVPQEKLFGWKMEVDRVIRRGTLLAAVIKGFPRELDRSEGNVAPASSLIVESGDTKFYWIPPASFKAALARLENPNDALENLTSDDEIFLDLPLTPFNKFCNSTGMIRTDGFYCWVVGEPEAADLNGVKGIPAGARTEFPVRFLTADDDTTFDFVPGVGITHYSYKAHDNPADTELTLVEFHPGSP